MCGGGRPGHPQVTPPAAAVLSYASRRATNASVGSCRGHILSSPDGRGRGSADLTGAQRGALNAEEVVVRGPQDRSRADEYQGREAVKATTRAAQEEFTGELEAKAELTDADLRDPALYINRELSMLDFFERVLDEARDTNNPLIERVKFVGIVGSILGEFFMVRIAGLRQQVEAGVTEASADGYTPQQLLPLAQERAWGVMKAARQCFSELRPQLEAAGIHIVDYADLDAAQQAVARQVLRGQGLPGAHAAGVRPRAAVPAHLQHEPQPRRAPARRQRRRAVRARQGPGLAAAARARSSSPPARTSPRTAWSTSGSPGSSRSSRPTSRRCSPAWTCWSRTRSA